MPSPQSCWMHVKEWRYWRIPAPPALTTPSMLCPLHPDRSILCSDVMTPSPAGSAVSPEHSLRSRIRNDMSDLSSAGSVASLRQSLRYIVSSAMRAPSDAGSANSTSQYDRSRVLSAVSCPRDSGSIVSDLQYIRSSVSRPVITTSDAGSSCRGHACQCRKPMPLTRKTSSPFSSPNQPGSILRAVLTTEIFRISVRPRSASGSASSPVGL